MIFREAILQDISQIQLVRHSVKENTLSDPSLVTNQDCADYMMERGKGWVCEIDGAIVGFSIVDLVAHNVWALFVDPFFEKKGIGRQLQALMLDWYFNQTQTSLWLGTASQSRAEVFYRRSGWTEVGTHGKGEIKFEMSYKEWLDFAKK